MVRAAFFARDRSTVVILNPIQRRTTQEVVVKSQGKKLLLTNVMLQHDRSNGLVPIICPARPLPFAAHALANIHRRTKRVSGRRR